MVYARGHQHGARGHQVARKDHVGRSRAYLENSIKMMSIVTCINIINDYIIGKLNYIFTSEVCIKLVALSVNRHPRSSSQLHKGWWPLIYTFQHYTWSRYYDFLTEIERKTPLFQF